MDIRTHNESKIAYRFVGPTENVEVGWFIRHENGVDIGRARGIKYSNLSAPTANSQEVPTAVAIAEKTNAADGAVAEAAEVELSPSEGPIVEIDPEMPWASWPTPVSVTGDIKSAFAIADGNTVTIALANGEGQEPTLLGIPTSGALKQMGLYAGFPVDFVEKLTADLRAPVISNRLRHAEYHDFNFIRDEQNNRLTNLMPSWRQPLPYASAAQFVYNRLCDAHTNVEVDEAECSGGTMSARFTTNLEKPITPKLGDTLKFGIQLNHDYGKTIEINVYAQRLVCLNGMTSSRKQFKWSHRTMGTPENQLSFLDDGIGQCAAAFNQMVDRSKTMSETTFEGDAHDVLQERAKALGISPRLNHRIFAAFDEEPGDSEWHIVNAFTRVATHDLSINERQRRQLMMVAGEYTRQFEMVDAHLPAFLAQKIGAAVFNRNEELVEA
jgi:hypothetical protein